MHDDAAHGGGRRLRDAQSDRGAVVRHRRGGAVRRGVPGGWARPLPRHGTRCHRLNTRTARPLPRRGTRSCLGTQGAAARRVGGAGGRQRGAAVLQRGIPVGQRGAAIANEELETSKEELQSLNEELQTINAELNQPQREPGAVQQRPGQPVRQHLHRDAVPGQHAAHPALHAAPAGHLQHPGGRRRAADLRHRHPPGTRDGLGQDVRQVLRNLSSLEREVAVAEAGVNYLMQVRPYRDAEQRRGRRRRHLRGHLRAQAGRAGAGAAGRDRGILAGRDPRATT